MATELEIMIHAKSYLDKLANGINPLTDETLPESDVVKQVRISRCLSYVSDVLNKVIENNGIVKQYKSNNYIPFHLTEEQVRSFQFFEQPVYISTLAQRINEMITEPGMRHLVHNSVTAFLINQGYMQIYVDSQEKNKRWPTETGRKLGISTAQRTGTNGEYTVVLYNKNAQRYILEHMKEIEEINRVPKKERISPDSGKTERVDPETGEIIRGED